MWPYPWTHVGTPSHLGHMDPVAATMPSQAHAGAAQEAPDIGQWEGQDVPLVRPSSCIVKGGILGVPLLPLARWVGRVAPVRPTHGVLVLSCPSAALHVRGVPGLLAPVHRCTRPDGCNGIPGGIWLLLS